LKPFHDPLGEPAASDAIVRKILAECRTVFGAEALPQLLRRSVQHLPYSTVIRLVFSVEGAERAVYAKIPRNEDLPRIRRESDILRYYSKELGVDGAYCVVHPLAVLSDPPCLVTAQGEGLPLNTVVRDRAVWLPSSRTRKQLGAACRMCGEWLREFQQVEPPEGDTSYRDAETVEFIHDQMTQCRKEALFDRKLVERLRRFVDSAAAAMGPDAKLTGMHSDFILSNILVAPTRVSVLDFSRCRTGPACRDVASLLYSLDALLTNPMFRPSTVRSLKQAFVAGYGWNPEEENAARFALFRTREILGGLLQMARRTRGGYRQRWRLGRARARAADSLSRMARRHPNRLVSDVEWHHT